MADLQLDKSSERIAAGQEAGDTYQGTLETIRNDLTKTDQTGTTLGTMVGSNLEMIEAESTYQIEQGVPKKASSTVKDAAGEIKKSAG
ncbi:MAG: hypothetical protein AB7F28_06575 [Candidatus Margulisiibacteriota bacterium]